MPGFSLASHRLSPATEPCSVEQRRESPIFGANAVNKKAASSMAAQASMPMVVEPRGLEPLTSGLQSRRSSQLSYTPTHGLPCHRKAQRHQARRGQPA